MQRKEADFRFASSFLRREGEDNDAPLNRLAALPVPIEAEMLTAPHSRKLYEVILKYAAKRLSLTPQLAAELIEWPKLLTLIADTQSDAFMVYAEQVLHFAQLEEVRGAAEDITQAAAADDPGAAVSEMARRVAMIRMNQTDRIGSAAEHALAFRKEFARDQENLRTGKTHFTWPTNKLNEYIPMVMAGWMILLTAESKIGKTSFASQIADWNATKNKLCGVYFHFEDTPKMMSYRRMARRNMLQSRSARADPSMRDMMSTVLSGGKRKIIERTIDEVRSWGNNLIEVYSAGWTMAQVVRTFLHLHTKHKMDFFVVDYLNKAELSPETLKAHGGPWGGRGHDAELLKRTAEATGTVGLLLQQEVKGVPYETKMGIQKSQVWLSLDRDPLDGGGYGPYGHIVVRAANMGQTGAIAAMFDHRAMMWTETEA